MTPPPRPPRIGRWILRWRSLGEHGAEVEADLLELFHIRAAERGHRYAAWRYLRDALSVWTQAPRPLGRQWMGLPRSRRSQRGLGMGQDVVFALRLFRRHPFSYGVAVAGLALAIGVATTVFSLVNVLMLRSLGIVDVDRVVSLVRGPDEQSGAPWALPDFLRVEQAVGSVDLAAMEWYQGSFKGAESSIQPSGERVLAFLEVTAVSGAYFPVLGGRTALGRPLAPSDDVSGAPKVAVLNHGYWVGQLASDQTVVGRDIRIDDASYTVVGVMASGFTGPMATGAQVQPAAWITMAAKTDAVRARAERSTASRRQEVERLKTLSTLTAAERQRLADYEYVLRTPKPPWNYVRVLGRLRPHVTAQQAEGEVSTALVGVMRDEGRIAEADKTTVHAVSVDSRRSDGLLQSIAVLSAAVGLVVCLASANVANLLLAGAIVRRREFATRLAIGASRWRLMRQMLTESLLLGLAAGLCGLLVSWWLAPVMGRLLWLPPALEVEPDATVFVFVAALSIVVGIVSGLAPARYGRRGDLISATKSDQLGAPAPLPRGLLRQLLVGGQAAAALVLLVGSALFVRSLVQAATADLGFDADRIFSFYIGNGTNGRAWDRERAAAFWDSALERVRSIPGVESASLALSPPFAGLYASARLVDGRAVQRQEVSADYFDTVGARVLRGRVFTPDEVRRNADVVVISRRLARAYWGDDDPVGSTLQRIVGSEGTDRSQGQLRLGSSGTRVIGVVEETVTGLHIEKGSPGTIYLPADLSHVPRLVVRVRDNAAGLAGPVQDALKSVDPDVRARADFASEGFSRDLSVYRTLAGLAAGIGLTALALAVVGLFGVTSFVTSQRRHEVSVRMALGADRHAIVRLLLRDNLKPVAIGLVAGVGIALLLGQVVQGALYNVSGRDPVAICAAVFVLLSVGISGILPTIRRASRADLAVLLRQ